LADFRVQSKPRNFRIECMRIYYPGVVMIPLLILLMGAASLAGSERIWNFWPVTLIATGLEELYLWARTRA
jgi:hypothetical protein